MTRRTRLLPAAIVTLAALGALLWAANVRHHFLDRQAVVQADQGAAQNVLEAATTPSPGAGALAPIPAPTDAKESAALIPAGAPLNEKSQTPTKKATPAKATADTNPTVSTATISVGGVNDIDPAKAFGSKSAPVVVEIFSDFQCPACRALFLNTTQKVMDNYVTTGKIYLVHRDFPLPMHAYSRVAASYARAAAHIGKCEPVEMALFQNQDKWEANGDVKGTVASVLSPAEMKKVEAIVESKQLEPLIEKDKAIGQTFPVTQTPTTVFHANGQTYPYAGSLNYDVLKDFLDQLVKQK